MRIHPLIIFASLVSACGSKSPSTTPQTTSGGLPLTATFSSIAQNILVPKCQSCHGSDVTGYSTLMSTGMVVPGKPTQSQLYQAVSSGRMPQTGTPLTQTQVSAIGSWIQAGAKNN